MKTSKNRGRMPRVVYFSTFIGVILLAGGFPAAAQTDSSGHAPTTITMRDCKFGYASASFLSLSLTDSGCPVQNDRVQSDTGLSYVGQQEGVEAYIGTQGTAGNIWLKTINSSRSLFLDLTECASAAAECNAPFASQYIRRAQIYVTVSAVRRNGVFGMRIGERLAAPARIYYRREEDSVPGFIEFNPNISGKSPCKNRGNLVNITRTGQNTWEVLANPDTTACVTLPNGQYAGTYRMPFRFHVRLHE